MDPRREELQAIFEGVLGTGNVYFQPPTNVQMQYPCIVYKRERTDTQFAGNVPYGHDTRYLVTVIDRDPDSVVVKNVRNLPKCLHIRFFTFQDLNHDVFTLVF